MTWNQIEKKWAAMARRVRADWKGEMHDDASQPIDERQSSLTEKKRSAVMMPEVQTSTTIAALAE